MSTDQFGCPQNLPILISRSRSFWEEYWLAILQTYVGQTELNLNERWNIWSGFGLIYQRLNTKSAQNNLWTLIMKADWPYVKSSLRAWARLGLQTSYMGDSGFVILPPPLITRISTPDSSSNSMKPYKFPSKESPNFVKHTYTNVEHKHILPKATWAQDLNCWCPHKVARSIRFHVGHS